MRAWPGARSPGSREPGHRTCSIPAPSRCRRTYAAVPCPFALSDPALSLQWPAVTEAIHSPRDAWGPEQQYMPCLDTANGQEHAAREQEKPLAPAKARVGIQCEPSPDGLRVTGITAGSSAAQSQIMVNDLLTIVNSEFLAGMEHEEMLQTLTGSAGSVLELTALREVDGIITTVYEQVVADASLAQEIQLLDLSSSFAPSIAQRHATSLRIAPQCQGVKSDSSQGELRFSAAPPGEHEPLRECETTPAAADDSSSAAKRGMLASAFQERNKPQVSRASAPADQVSLTDHAPVQVQRSSAPDPAHNPGPSGKQQPDSPATNKWRVRSVVAMLLLLLVMVLFVFGGGQSSAGGQDEAVGSVHVVAQPIAADNGTQAVASMWPSPPESVPLATPGDAPAADKQEQDERREEKMHVKEDHNHQQAIETHQNNQTADTISKVASLSPGGAIVKKNTIEADCEEERNGSDTEHMQGEKGSSAWASSSLAHHDVANDVGQNRADADVDVQQGFPTSGIPPVEAEAEDAERGTREENLNIASEGTERAATPSDEKNVLNLQNDQRSRDQEALEAIAPADDSAVKTDVNNQAKASPADDTTPAAGEEDVALTQEASHAESANPVADCTTCVGSSSPTTNLIPQEMGRAQIDLTHEEALMGDLESSKNESPWTGQISEDGRSSSLNALEKKDEGSSTGPFNLSDASNESSSSVNGRHGQDIPVPTQTDGKRAAWLASMSSLLSLASSKNASGRNASQSDEGRAVSYMESLSRLLDTVSSQASNVTMMAGNESASYFKAVSSLLAVHSSGLLSANVSANGTHNASSFGDPWGRFLAGVFVRASNATSFVANDSASYLDSLSSLLTAYSPSQFVNASSSPVPTQTDGKRAAWLASMSSLLSLASSKNASGRNASQSDEGRTVSYMESLSRLLDTVSSQASNVTMMAGNESASYFKAVSSLFITNVSAVGTHNASSFGDPWGRFLAGVFVRASNATSFVANDSASYLDSLSSLLTAYSPSQFVNASSSPVPTQTDGKRAAWLASMSSLLSLASSKNASGSDASSSSSRYLSASSNLNRLLGSFVQQSQGEPGTAELTGEIQGKSGKLIPFLMVSFLMMMLVGAICVCKRSRARVNTHSSQRALRSTAPQRRVADIDPGEQWRRSKFQPFDIPTQPEHDSLNPVAARVAKNPFMAKRLRSQHGELEPLRECETAPAAADGSSSAAKRGPKSSLAGGLALAVVVVWLMTKLNATRAILAVLGGMDSQRTTLMFTRMDADSSGGLSLEEVRLWFKDETFLSHLFSKADSNRDSLISFEESQQYEENERNLQLAVEKFEMSISHQELFQEMDTDGSGYLSQVELRHVLKEQGDYQDEDGLMTLFKNMDVDGDGGISFREADDYETKDAANSYISTYVNTVSDLLAKSIRGEEKGGEVQSAL